MLLDQLFDLSYYEVSSWRRSVLRAALDDFRAAILTEAEAYVDSRLGEK